MYEERRQWPRHPRFLRTTFTWDGTERRGITLDISIGGAFLNTTVFPPKGTWLELAYSPDGSDHTIRFHAEVVRVADLSSGESVAPGLGLRWTEICAATSADDLGATLSVIFRSGVTAHTVQGGMAQWKPDVSDDGSRDSAETDADDIVPTWLADKDDRQTPRSGLSILADFYINKQKHNGRIRDISHRGIYIESATSPELGSVCVCNYPVPSAGTARVVGVVTRTDSTGFAAATLSVVDDTMKKHYDAHVSELLNSKG